MPVISSYLKQSMMTALLAGTALVPTLAGAQDASPDIGEIVVTAQKRTERLVDIPLAVSVVSPRDLLERNINDTNGLVSALPSLTYTQGNNVSNSTFRVRGVGTTLFNQGSESSVSTVIDGVVLARQAQGFVDLADLERVELLRGPQGTLFGKNATAGVINVVTARPTRTWSGRAEATIAEQDEYRVRGTLSGPLSDTLAVRVSGFYNDVGGHITNIATGADKNGYESWGVRGKLLWDATPDLDLLTTVDYRKTDADCCQPQFLQVESEDLAYLLLPSTAGKENREVNIDTPSFNKTDQLLASLEANLRLGDHVLTSITAWQDFNFDNNVDIDFISAPDPVFVPFGVSKGLLNGGPAGVQQFSQELRIASPGDARFSYVAGLYYLDLDVSRGFRRRMASCIPGGANGGYVLGQACAAPLYLSTYHSASSKTEQFAAFGQVDFRLTDALSLIGGARLQRETVSYEGNRPGLALVEGDVPLSGASVGAGSTRDTDLSGRLGLQYRLGKSAQAYVTWTRGYKGAAYDIEVSANFVDQAPVRPETVKAWEAGIKAELLDRLLSVNLAAFSATYSDLQVQAARLDTATGNTLFVPTNAGSARTRGVELEFTATPARGLSINGGVTYLDTSVDVDGLACPLPDQADAPVLSGAPVNQCYKSSASASPLLNLRDGRLPNAPSWRGMLSARYESALAGTGLTVFGQVTGNAQSKVLFALEQDIEAVQRAYGTIDASIGLRGPDNRISLTLFVRNLTDKTYVSSIGRGSGNAANPYNLTGFVPKDATRYFGATLSAGF